MLARETALDSPAQNMVQGQLAPNGIRNSKVLDAFLCVDRMAFVPEAQKPQSYCDVNVTDKRGNLLLQRPLISAIMMQYIVEEAQGQRIAVIGDDTGYLSSVLKTLGYAPMQVADEEALKQNGPFDVILVHGAVACVPDYLFPFLAEDGKVICLVQSDKNAMGEIAACADHKYIALGQGNTPYFEPFKLVPSFTL